MSLRRLRKSDIKQLDKVLPIALDRRDEVALGDGVLMLNGSLAFIQDGDAWIPALPLLLARPSLLPRLVVDMGAVRHVTRGADVMRPGVTVVPDVAADAFVVVVDAVHGKPLAVGRALLDGASMREQSSGRVVQNLHWVGDPFWQQYVH